MKIALLSYRIGHGGQTHHILELSKELITKGHEVYIFTTGTFSESDKIESDKLSEFARDGAHIVKVKRPKKKKSSLIGKIYSGFFILQIQFFLIFHRIDLIHVHDNSFAPFIYKLNKRFVRTQHMGYDIEKTIPVKASHEIAISTQ